MCSPSLPRSGSSDSPTEFELIQSDRTILIPLNLITGLWGMNVHVPGQDVTEGYTWFFSVCPALPSPLPP